MIVERLSNQINIREYLKMLCVDSGGVNILSDKAKINLISIKNIHVGAANILKQDALSIGADLAVPRGTVVAKEPYVNTLLIATNAHLKILSHKELAQPFGLKELAHTLKKYIHKPVKQDILIMGIINANDDSFFAQSRFCDENAIIKIEEMIKAGATIIDIGGVSSAPNAQVVTAEEELQRVQKIIDIIHEQDLYKKAQFSIDSYQPLVIEYALKSGFKIVNDITGLANDEVCHLCAKYDATAIIMHMQGTPQTMQNNPRYDNILTEIYDFLEKRSHKAESFGIKSVILDVGVGFGKTLKENLILIKHLEHFQTLNKRLLIGASRKSMIHKIDNSDVQNRLGGTLALHLEAIGNGASILRVHDVEEHVQALKIEQALRDI